MDPTSPSLSHRTWTVSQTVVGAVRSMTAQHMDNRQARTGATKRLSSPPQFNPLEIDVEWKVLPKDLMYDILQIPSKREHITSRLAGIAEHSDPYDPGDYFWSRQRDYAELGLHTLAVAKRLRKPAGLPIDEVPSGEWNRADSLQEVIDDIDQKRAAYEKRLAESHAKNPMFANLGQTSR